ncbi:MAG: L-2-amino-thiazoline-4-carboxylic acid hydrolase [Myxococcales bacterium]|nr:L-2-amino-thiazoline-4-carboxylic acid hydrolase [Myxococcales bacterium]
MRASPFYPSPLDRARILGLYLAEIRKKAGVLAEMRAAAALASPATLRRQSALAGVGTTPILHAVVGAVATYQALVRSLGAHRALGSVRAAVVAAARGLAAPTVALPPGTDPLDDLAAALEATLSVGQELGVYEVRWLEGAPGTVQLEILRCRIHELCHAAGAPEVTSCFCDAEAPVLTRDSHLVLVRDMTLARGAPLCRFTFHVVGDLEARREPSRPSPAPAHV